MESILIPSVVEGHGEVQALPVLLRRLAALQNCGRTVLIPPPIRMPKGSLMNRPDELRRAIELAALNGRSPERSFIITLVDSDGACPAAEAPQLLNRCQSIRPDFSHSVILANREFESWFLASAESLRGKRKLPADLARPDDPEAISDCKGWIRRFRCDRKYSPTIDQPAYSTFFDINEARSHSSSFDKFCRDFERLISTICC